jgi:hypothetical protein
MRKLNELFEFIKFSHILQITSYLQLNLKL